jgi:hypothetical protein
MAYLTIPVRSDLDTYKFTIDLEKITYGFDFHWNDRMGKWVFDISDSTASAIVQSLPIYVNQLPLDRFRDERLPPGTLLFIDTAGTNLDPGRDDFGSRVLMIYIESTEVI